MSITNDEIRREFLAAGFTIKPGCEDLKPYVYEAALRVIALAEAAERDRLCEAIKAADDKASESDYMLDSDDCIRVIRGTWNPDA
jgi:hypothetical protein